MKKASLLFLLLPLISTAQSSLPSYPSLLQKFFSEYSYTPKELIDGLNFAKMKDGWHVQVIDRVSERVKQDQIYYSIQEGYQVVNGFDSAGADGEESVQRILSGGNVYNWYGYERCRYYGYSHWSEDLMSDFGAGGKTNYNDTLLEGLARAYSAYASKFLWHQYGGQSESNDSFKRKLAPLEMPSKERADSVAYYIGKSIEVYQLLSKKNNRYTTLLGNPGMKVFNEQMNAYMHLSMAGYDSLARTFLLAVRPSKTVSAIAHNYLDACAPNAILFTYGDNDTYPLWYVQAREGYRKDVAVIHTSLVGLPAYLQMLKRKNLVQFSTTAPFYGDSTFLYFVKDHKEGLEKLPLEGFIKIIQDRKNITKSEVYGDMITYPCDTIEMRIDVNRFKTLWREGNLNGLVKIALQDYLLNEQFIVLDIINSNVYSRPIYMTSTYDLLPENFLQTGTVYQFLPLDPSKITSSYEMAVMRIKAFLRQYTTVPSETDFADVTCTIKNEEVLGLYSFVGNYYLQKHEEDSAAVIAKDLLKRFNKKLPAIIYENKTADLLLANGYIAEGRMFLEECAEMFYRLYKKPSAMYGYKTETDALNFMKSVQSALSRYGVESKKIAALMDAFGK